MKFRSNKDVISRIEHYPDGIRDKLLAIRKSIETIATSIDSQCECVETFKWNEPSYTSKISSTIRMDWKEKNPEHYSLFFNCQSRIVETAKGLFDQDFVYVGNREIRFNIHDDPFKTPFLPCILRAALEYHIVKSDPLLGMGQ